MRAGKRLRLLAGTALASLMAAVGSTAHAQTAQPSPPEADAPQSQVSEVVVTARKRSERLQSVPVAVTALDAGFLEREQVRDVRDFAAFTPNLTINPVTLQANGAAVYIRGFGVQDIDRTYAPAVSIVLDGVTFGSSTSGQLLNVYDLEQVEVLRGPQGTLFGPNSIGGAILLTRPKPTGVLGGHVSGTFGSYGRNDLKAALDFPITSDLSGRISFARLNDDGAFLNDFDGNSRGFKDFYATSVALRYQKEKFDAQLNVDWLRDRSDWGVLQNLSNQFDLWCVPLGSCYDPNRDLRHVDQHGDPQYLRTDTLNAILNINYALSPTTTLTAITGVNRVHEKKGTNFDGLPIPLFSSVQPVDETQFSQEFRVNWKPLANLNLTSGFYYGYDDYSDGVNTLYIFSLFGLPPGATEVVSKHQRTFSYGLFTQGDYQLTDKLSLTLGLRYTNETKRYIYRQGFGKAGDFYPGFTGFTNIASGNHTWTEATPRVGLNYKVTPDVLTYVSFAQGFKSGGFNGRGNSLDTIGPYDPETVDTYEIGVKSELLKRRLRLNLAAFYNDYKNKQEAVVRRNPDTGATITPTVNAGAATTKGVEAELEAVLSHGFTVRATAAYLDANYDRFDYDGSDASKFVKLLVTPEFQFSITPDYRVDIGSGVIDANMTYAWTDDFETELGPRYDGGVGPLWNDPRGHVAAHGILSGALSYEFGAKRSYKITVFGRNITDELYIAAAAPAANLFTLGTPSQPRTWGVELSAKF